MKQLKGLAPPVVSHEYARNGRNFTKYFKMEGGSGDVSVRKDHQRNNDDEVNDDDATTPSAMVKELKGFNHDVSGTGRYEGAEKTEWDQSKGDHSSRLKMTPSEFYKRMKKVRMKRHKMGLKWGGWYDDVATNSNREKKENKLIGDIEHWWRNSQNCFEVDHLCHLKRKAHWDIISDKEVEKAEEYLAGLHEWFYYDDIISKHESKGEETRRLFQPSMSLKFHPNKYDRGTHAETRISIKVMSPSSLSVDGDDADGEIFSFKSTLYPTNFKVLGNDSFSIENDKQENTICRVSPTPTHIVVQSTFNDMIGEFYTRTLVELHQLMSKTVHAAAETKGNKNDGSAKETGVVLPWEQDIQFYVHLAFLNKKLLDGHKLLLGSMLTSPEANDVKSFLDLFVEQDEDVSENNDGDECQCYEKMVFCGYDVYIQNGDFDSSEKDDDEPIMSSARDIGDDDDVDSNSFDDDVSRNFHEGEDNNDEHQDSQVFENNSTGSSNKQLVRNHAYKSMMPPVENLKYTLWPTGGIGAGTSRLECSQSNQNSRECHAMGDFRKFLLSNIMRHYPSVKDDFVSHRRQVLLDKGFVDEAYRGDTKEWKIIGLTQRTYRRTWLNLPEVIDVCDELHKVSKHNVACVEVNVEKTKSPMEQLLLHGKLDGLIGVHGAQLTQAILLPRNAHVLELLPWIPNYISGNWVQRRSSPTPLGVIFHNTDLNHLGYSLGRDSVPLCEGEEGENLKKCFLRKGKKGNFKKFLWPRRDFNVNPEPVVKYIEKVVIPSEESRNMTSCDEMRGRLDKRFVWYNIWCDDGIGSTGYEINTVAFAKHFYDSDMDATK